MPGLPRDRKWLRNSRLRWIRCSAIPFHQHLRNKIAGVVTYQTGTTVSTPIPSQAPNGLDLVIDFVNTLDLDEGTDALETPDGLREWLAEERLLNRANAPVSAGE